MPWEVVVGRALMPDGDGSWRVLLVGGGASALGVALVVFCTSGAGAGVLINFDTDAFGNSIAAPGS